MAHPYYQTPLYNWNTFARPPRVVRLMDEIGEKLGKWANNPQNIEKVRESCPFNVLMHSTMGFAFGGLLGMFLASMSAGGTSPEAQLLSHNVDTSVKAIPLKLQVRHDLTDLVKKSWGSAKNFAAIAALYSGSECIIEGVITLYVHALF